MKIVRKANTSNVQVKDGRKVAATIETTLPDKVIDGLIAGMDTTDLDLDGILAALQSAIDAAAAKRGSVVPDEYRYKYGADQNCGDDVAKRLTAAVTGPDGVDLTEARKIAALNGVEDRFDGWMAKDLNPGMVRMNLGNVLRGLARKEQEVRFS
jgi:hypothetical protein